MDTEDTEFDFAKLKKLFFDPQYGYGSAELRNIVSKILESHKTVSTYLNRFVDTKTRHDLLEDSAYEDQKSQLTNLLSLVFDASFDHGTNNPKARFVDAVKALGLDDGEDAGVAINDSAEHYYGTYRNQMIQALIAEMEVARIADRSLI